MTAIIVLYRELHYNPDQNVWDTLSFTRGNYHSSCSPPHQDSDDTHFTHLAQFIEPFLNRGGGVVGEKP